MIELARIQDKTLEQQGITATLLNRGEGTEEMKGWKSKYILERILGGAKRMSCGSWLFCLGSGLLALGVFPREMQRTKRRRSSYGEVDGWLRKVRHTGIPSGALRRALDVFPKSSEEIHLRYNL